MRVQALLYTVAGVRHCLIDTLRPESVRDAYYVQQRWSDDARLVEVELEERHERPTDPAPPPAFDDVEGFPA